MVRTLHTDVQSIITSGKPYPDTKRSIARKGYTILNTLPLHDLQPDYGSDGDYITFYVKTSLKEMEPAETQPHPETTNY